MIVNCVGCQNLRRIERTLRSADPSVRILLYFSGHGIPDAKGRLHLITSDTRRDELGSSAIAVERIHSYMDESRAEAILVILDCCYSGSFGQGINAPHLPYEDLTKIGGRGRGIFVLVFGRLAGYEDVNDAERLRHAQAPLGRRDAQRLSAGCDRRERERLSGDSRLCEGAKEDKTGWSAFLKHLKERVEGCPADHL